MWRQSRSFRAALASLFARWRGIAIAAFGPRSPGRITALVLTTACSACSTSAPRHEWEQRLQGNAVAMLGEVHDNAQSHRDRLEVLRRALVAGWRPAIAMEQFDREHQSDIARARRERPRDAQYLIDLAAPSGTKAREGWNWAFYRPFVALALQYDLPLIAANLSNADTTRIVRDGYAAVFDVASLAALQLDKPIASDWQAAQEREIDAGHCGALQPAQWPRMARAQFARDAVMAQALREHAARGVVLLAGNGHVRRDTGVPRWMGDAWRERIVSVGYLETGDESLRASSFDAVVWVAPAPRPNPCVAFKRRAVERGTAERSPQ
jgi:uncharacterized iron-regulated protein